MDYRREAIAERLKGTDLTKITQDQPDHAAYSLNTSASSLVALPGCSASGVVVSRAEVGRIDCLRTCVQLSAERSAAGVGVAESTRFLVVEAELAVFAFRSFSRRGPGSDEPKGTGSIRMEPHTESAFVPRWEAGGAVAADLCSIRGWVVVTGQGISGLCGFLRTSCACLPSRRGERRHRSHQLPPTRQ